jgi:hypothetical protein
VSTSRHPACQPGDRLRLLAELLDEGTFPLLAARGLQRGWRCLEMGAGGGSVATWLGQQVAPGGSVLDTVIDLCADPRLRFMSQATIAAWGHRPH